MLCEWKDLEHAYPGQTVAMIIAQVVWVLSDNTRSRTFFRISKAACSMVNYFLILVFILI